MANAKNEFDSWELFEPVDILPKISSTFYTDLQSKKWLERKASVESLHALLNENPRLDPKAHYGEVVQTLKTVLDKDANINVASVAAKCLTCFAKGLRKNFAQHVRILVPVILEKFKEKKPVLREPLIECIDAVYSTTTLDNILDEIMEASTKPNPDIKINVDLSIYRCLKCLRTAEVPKKFIKEFMPILLKHANDSDKEVRNASCSALGAIMKCIGKNSAVVLFGDLVNDKLKMSKVEEAHAVAVQEAAEEEKKLKVKHDAALNASSSLAGSSSANENLMGTADAFPAKEEVDSWELFEPVDILPKISSTFYTDVQSKKWLERKESIETLLALLNENPRLDPKAHYGEVVQTLKTILDKDANINVASVAAKCLTCFAKGLRKNFAQHVRILVPVILAKFKEKKPVLREPLIECIDAVYSTTTLDNILEEVMEASTKQNPDIKINVDLSIYRCLKCLQTAEVPKKFIKEFTPILVKHASDSDKEVRNASCSALGAIMKCIGKKAAVILFGDLTSDKLKMSKIEEVYDKIAEEDSSKTVLQSKPNNLIALEKLIVKKTVKLASEKLIEESKSKRGEVPDAGNEVKLVSLLKEESKSQEASIGLKANSDRAGRAKDEKAHKPARLRPSTTSKPTKTIFNANRTISEPKITIAAKAKPVSVFNTKPVKTSEVIKPDQCPDLTARLPPKRSISRPFFVIPNSGASRIPRLSFPKRLS